jgi:hypothetical protein
MLTNTAGAVAPEHSNFAGATTNRGPKTFASLDNVDSQIMEALKDSLNFAGSIADGADLDECLFDYGEGVCDGEIMRTMLWRESMGGKAPAI